MTSVNDKFIQDAAAFIRWALENNKDHLIMPTLVHDIAGLADKRPCFLPRVDGYSGK